MGKYDGGKTTGLAEMFTPLSPSYENQVSRDTKFGLKRIAKITAISLGTTSLIAAGLIAAHVYAPAPHAERIGEALEKWSVSNPSSEIPESTTYVKYSSYLMGLGPRSAEFGLPSFGKDNSAVQVKIQQADNANGPFIVCAYNSEGDTRTDGLTGNRSYYSFNSTSGTTTLNDPNCIP